MKAITVNQPWASFLAHGLKTFMSCSWRTGHRGPIAIHANRTKVPEHFFYDQNITKALESINATQETLPYGAIVGTALLARIINFSELTKAQKAEYTKLGDIKQEQYLWEFEDPYPFFEPRPHKGRLGLFEATLT